jgi:hypothetical protein
MSCIAPDRDHISSTLDNRVDAPSAGSIPVSPEDPVTSFTNPSTGTTYRLRHLGPAFRITKSRPTDDRVCLNHLRGVAGTGDMDLDLLRAFIRGESLQAPQPTDPRGTFTRLVLLDLDMAASLLTAMARESHAMFEQGRPGFRPGCALFRRQRDAALTRAMHDCMAMSTAWIASGLTTTDPLPDWLSSGIADAQRPSAHPRLA